MLSVIENSTPCKGCLSALSAIFWMTSVVVGSFSKSRLLPPEVPVLLPEFPEPPVLPLVPPLTTLLPDPFLTMMVWGVGSRT